MLPTPTNVLDARVLAGLTQCQAAEMVGLPHAYHWSAFELGTRPMDRTRWELFLIKVGRHQLYGPRQGVQVPSLQTTDPRVADEPMVVPKKHRREIARRRRERR